MLRRKIERGIREWYEASKRKVLMITGARQVGKTYIIREFCKENAKAYAEFNFLTTPVLVSSLKNESDPSSIFFALSAYTDVDLKSPESIIFLDEVQECKEIVTLSKYLVENTPARIILSGSLLGVELKDIRSFPVGYMKELVMYPLDIEEFFNANDISDELIAYMHDCFLQGKTLDPNLHQRFMELYRRYLIVGGMPDAVNAYLEKGNLNAVTDIQRDIINIYRRDFSRYEENSRLELKNIYDLIPSELNKQNKRFIVGELEKDRKVRFSRYENSFVWLSEAGVAIPVFNAGDLSVPPLANRERNLFKLFLSDIGLLTCLYGREAARLIIASSSDINKGAIAENFAAVQLSAAGYSLYYCNRKNIGEVDFVIEKDGHIILIEVKSGKSYRKHSALDNYSRLVGKSADKYVLSDGNLDFSGEIRYLPIYMAMCLQSDNTEDLIL